MLLICAAWEGVREFLGLFLGLTFALFELVYWITAGPSGSRDPLRRAVLVLVTLLLSRGDTTLPPPVEGAGAPYSATVASCAEPVLLPVVVIAGGKFTDFLLGRGDSRMLPLLAEEVAIVALLPSAPCMLFDGEGATCTLLVLRMPLVDLVDRPCSDAAHTALAESLSEEVIEVVVEVVMELCVELLLFLLLLFEGLVVSVDRAARSLSLSLSRAAL